MDCVTTLCKGTSQVSRQLVARIPNRMVENNSLESPFYLGLVEQKLIDISKVENSAFVLPPRAVRLTLHRVTERYKHEGIAFLTKTMPSLGKCLDKALSSSTRLNTPGWCKLPGTELPKFMGELFSCVFDNDGWILQNPDALAVKNLRGLLYSFYKLETTYAKETEDRVLRAFKDAEASVCKPNSPSSQSSYRGDAWGAKVAQPANLGAEYEGPHGTEKLRVSVPRTTSDLGNAATCDHRHLCIPKRDRCASGPDPIKWISNPDGQCRELKSVPVAVRYWDTDTGPGEWVYTGRQGSSRCSLCDYRKCPVCDSDGNRARASEARSCPEVAIRTCQVGFGKTAVEPTAGTQEERGSRRGSDRSGSSNECRAEWLKDVDALLHHYPNVNGRFGVWLTPGQEVDIARRARVLLHHVLSGLDLRDIMPHHGPGATATGEPKYGKYTSLGKRWIPRLAEKYSYDQMFFWSPSHLSDALFDLVSAPEVPVAFARVITVPKDSRGPRVISAEMLEIQAVQQGQMRSLRRRVEAHPLTKGDVSFTDQSVNQASAKLASVPFANTDTLDLQEASDRVSLRLIRALWPADLVELLESSRSECTILPMTRGQIGPPEVLSLSKFAPMGSSNCFPVMALTIWALSVGVISQVVDEWSGKPLHHSPIRTAYNLRGSVLVYGDDVITRANYTPEVMTALERFGLKLNRSKCCTGQLFKESCGVDSFNGVEVQPQYYREPWSSIGSPKHLESWCAYCNAHVTRGELSTAAWIAEGLEDYYGPLPRRADPTSVGFPCLSSTLCQTRDARPRIRWNQDLQCLETKVLVRTSKDCIVDEPSWCGLLRWAYETGSNPVGLVFERKIGKEMTQVSIKISARASDGQYANPEESYLSRSWRCG